MTELGLNVEKLENSNVQSEEKGKDINFNQIGFAAGKNYAQIHPVDLNSTIFNI